MATVTIGEKEYEVKVDNRVIHDIEQSFDGEGIDSITSNEDMSVTSLCKIVFNAIKHNISIDEFMDNIKLHQYGPAADIVGKEIAKAFTVDPKKKAKS